MPDPIYLFWVDDKRAGDVTEGPVDPTCSKVVGVTSSRVVTA